MAKVQISEVDSKLAEVNMGPGHSATWQIFEGWTTVYSAIFCEKPNVEGGWILKFIFCFMVKSGILKDHGHYYKYNLNL
jgi:hypothetical protein